MPPKPQDLWNIRNDNSSLQHTPNLQQANLINLFWGSYAEYFNHFIRMSQQIAHNACLSNLNFVKSSEHLRQVVEQIYEKGYILIDTISDFTNSYKGRISWIIVGFNDKGYIIDALLLHNQVKILKQVLQNFNIIKYCYRECILLEDTKRDWSAFGSNYFDFWLMEKSIGVKRAFGFVASKLSQRPIMSQLLQQFQDRYDAMINYLGQISYFLEKESQDKRVYVYSNQEQLLKQYKHITYTLQQEEKQYQLIETQLKKKVTQDKENNNQNQINDLQLKKNEQAIIAKRKRERSTCQFLLDWREHMAKIMDRPTRQILTFHQILVIAKERPTSILEIQQILSGDRLLTFELSSKILQILNYEHQINQNVENNLDISKIKIREQKNIKALLSSLKWEGREEWLNRRNDQSIRLYKQIVSIVELDDSVIEEFTQDMNKGGVGKNQVSRFIKYAEFMRNGNHKKLKEYYEQQKQQKQDLDSEEDQFICNKKAVSNSLTSLAGSSQKLGQEQEPNTKTTIKGPISLCSLNSDIQLCMLLPKMDTPLPQNIEEIYLKAVNVKKGYQKIQKRKGSKKYGQEQLQEFIPTWNQIDQLLKL